MAAAELAFPSWSATPPTERSSLLERASQLLMERQREIATLVTEETHGTLGWGMFNVKLAADMLAYYAGETDAPVEEQELPSQIPGKRAKAVRQPVGVVVGIAPWNAPVILGVRAVAAPLAYGNSVVLKASEICPRTHAAIVGGGRITGGDRDNRRRNSIGDGGELVLKAGQVQCAGGDDVADSLAWRGPAQRRGARAAVAGPPGRAGFD